MKKILSALTVLLFLLICFTSCSNDTDTTVVLKVGEYEITMDEFRFVCMKNAALMCEELGRPYDPELVDQKELQATVEKELRKYYAIEKMAKDYGISLTEKEIQAVKDAITAEKNSYNSKKEYKAALKEMYMTEDVCLQQSLNYTLEAKVFAYLSEQMKKTDSALYINEEQLNKDISERFYSTVHIWFLGENAAKSAENILRAIKSGEKDFMEVARNSNADSMKDQTHCYVMGEAYSYYEEAALALDPGELSEVVSYGRNAFILLRVPLQEDYIQEHRSELLEKDIVYSYNAMTEKIGSTLQIVETEKYPGLVLENTK